MRSRGARVTLFAVDAFAAMTAVGGGILVATGLDRLPAAWLAGTLFSSYLIPGLILAVVVGGSAAAATVATVRNPEAGALASLLAGVIMLGWIVGEVLILNQPSRPTWIEVVYFAVGLVMAVLGLMVGRAERRGRCSRVTIRRFRPEQDDPATADIPLTHVPVDKGAGKPLSF